jgi:hypothetical protein
MTRRKTYRSPPLYGQDIPATMTDSFEHGEMWLLLCDALEHVRKALDASSDKDKKRRYRWAEDILYEAWDAMRERLSNPPVLEDEMLALRKQLDRMIRQDKRRARKKAEA